MIWFRRIGIFFLCVAALAALLWLCRAALLETLIGAYFNEQGIASDVTIDRLGWSGLSGRVALGAPATISADAVDVSFGGNGWIPQVIAVRIVRPVVHARVDANGTITLPALQSWIDRITAGPAGHSRYISDDLQVELENLRAIVATPAGALELDGNARIKRGALVFLDATARPTVLTRDGQVLRIDRAKLSAHALATGISLTAQFAGSLNRDRPEQFTRAIGIDASLAASGIQWGTGDTSVATAQLQMTAQNIWAGAAHLAAPDMRVTLADIRTSSSGGHWRAEAEAHAQASAQTLPAEMRALFEQLPVIGAASGLANAVAAAAHTLTLNLGAQISAASKSFSLQLTAPASLDGNNHAMLRLNALSLENSADTLRGAVDAQMRGDGLPSLSLVSRKFAWTRAARDFTADAALRAHFDFDMLRDADLSVSGNAALHTGHFTLALDQCARAKVGALRTGRKATARRIDATICTNGNAPLVDGGSGGWTVTALARNLTAELPTVPARISAADGQFVLESHDRNGLMGRVRIAHARIADMARSPRFRPLTASGAATLSGDRVKGDVSIAGLHGTHIASVTFTHDVASGVGKADIAARDLRFDPKGLQPESLSPLLAQIRNADGRASFTGAVAWTRKALTSHGVLDIAEMNFSSPLGPAQALHSSIAFRSLLPPVTADGQKLDIAAINWVLPFTNTQAVFALTPDALRLDAAKTDVAGGAASLGGLTVELTGAGTIRDTARLDNIDLAQIVAATNIGNQVKVEGRVTGVLPFTSGPEGFRIAKGHIESVGPGRLEIDPTLWTKGAPVTDAVHNFAYQALENLAVDSMTADVDSVDNGRLRIIFHIKGRSDPPKPQEAKVGLIDLLRGTAFSKPVALPSETPIDLTLETSLNFDELLRSYQAAWSNSLKATPNP
jgi:hypothetical protein